MRLSPACSALVLIALAAATLGAQDKTDKKAQKDEAGKTPKVISLSGCVVRGEKLGDPVVIEDKSEGRYRLSGISLRDYLGQRVQIAGGERPGEEADGEGRTLSEPERRRAGWRHGSGARGGGSAGGAAGPGTVELPEFKVKSVRPVSGGCPQLIRPVRRKLIRGKPTSCRSRRNAGRAPAALRTVR